MILKYDKTRYWYLHWLSVSTNFCTGVCFMGTWQKVHGFLTCVFVNFPCFFPSHCWGLEWHLVLCFIIENKSRSWYETEYMDFCHAFWIREAELLLVQSNLERFFCMCMCVDACLEFDCGYRGFSLLNETEFSFPCMYLDSSLHSSRVFSSHVVFLGEGVERGTEHTAYPCIRTSIDAFFFIRGFTVYYMSW